MINLKPLSRLKLFLLPVLYVLFSTYANAQILAWAKVIGGVSSSEGKDVAVDARGNVYTVGQFVYDPLHGGPVEFDPGPASYNFYQSGSFISKMDSNGNFLWARNLPGAGITGSSIKAI